MNQLSTASADLAETIREGHLRLAVLLDLIEDELAAGQPVARHIEKLREDFEYCAGCEEEMLRRSHPEVLENHLHGHDRMRTLLCALSGRHRDGDEIGLILKEVVGMFTGQLMPAFSMPAGTAHP